MDREIYDQASSCEYHAYVPAFSFFLSLFFSLRTNYIYTCSTFFAIKLKLTNLLTPTLHVVPYLHICIVIFLIIPMS